MYTVEPLYRGHHWDPTGCPVYSGTFLWWTPLGPSWLSCTQWNLSIVDTIGSQVAVLYTMESLYSGHHWDTAEVDCTQLYVVWTAEAVLIREVSFI